MRSKSGYRPDYHPELIRGLALLGLQNNEIFKLIQISEDTFYRWTRQHPELKKALEEGRELADARIATALYQRALGYQHQAVKIFQFEGQIIEAPYIERYPPDTQAASLFLRNRHPKNWKNRVDVEVDGNVIVQPINYANLLQQQAAPATKDPAQFIKDKKPTGRGPGRPKGSKNK